MTLCPFLRQCGYPHGSLSFLSSGNVMLLTLLTNEEKNFPGFRANYSQVPLTTPGTFGRQAARDRSRFTLPTTFSNTSCPPRPDCGGALTGDKGSLSSPFYPANYPPQTSCVWKIEVSQRVALENSSLADGTVF